ncbi:MAG: hypothetical protein NZ703_07950 [Gemmataceae bacterium]|nr:hypothetical protein [Gemmataceae bacterium]MCS7271002.1 hypothetical protein [Gemmataceae bacterium]MDW8244449.1 hypothetical protein [Thermogemmata sp.]
MAESAEVLSVGAIEQWRAALSSYGETLTDALAGVELELRRVHDWLEEQLIYWKRMVRQREEEVVRAKAELAQRQFPGWDGRVPDCTVQRKNLQRAQARLDHARAQVECVRRWQMRFPKIVEETYRGAAHRLQRLLESTIPAALDDLDRRLRALEAYMQQQAAGDARIASSVPPPTSTPAVPAPTPLTHAHNQHQQPGEEQVS